MRLAPRALFQLFIFAALVRLPPVGKGQSCQQRIDVAFKSAECALSAMRKKLLRGRSDVPRDLAEQDWGQVTATMRRHGGRATILMAELLVRASPPCLLENERGENGDDFAQLENGTGEHWLSGHDDDLRADKLAFRRRGAAVLEHGDDFPEFAAEIVERLPWLCAPGKPGTWPTFRPVYRERSITAVQVRIADLVSHSWPDAILAACPDRSMHQGLNLIGIRLSDRFLILGFGAACFGPASARIKSIRLSSRHAARRILPRIESAPG